MSIRVSTDTNATLNELIIKEGRRERPFFNGKFLELHNTELLYIWFIITQSVELFNKGIGSFRKKKIRDNHPY